MIPSKKKSRETEVADKNERETLALLPLDALSNFSRGRKTSRVHGGSQLSLQWEETPGWAHAWSDAAGWQTVTPQSAHPTRARSPLSKLLMSTDWLQPSQLLSPLTIVSIYCKSCIISPHHYSIHPLNYSQGEAWARNAWFTAIIKYLLSASSFVATFMQFCYKYICISLTPWSFWSTL